MTCTGKVFAEAIGELSNKQGASLEGREKTIQDIEMEINRLDHGSRQGELKPNPPRAGWVFLVSDKSPAQYRLRLSARVFR
ncbi:Uncharacterised protein [Serratia ficaria]|uniref:Uncharacterized protein n=1 Tax=Serratia ficaria TaxID=61651 RepID=A0A240BNY9_SERFI|nr:hypothetical protein [Serratia ficaria]REF45801.1 hypothetical protein C7332_4148 [Serratia ficaria]CAI0812221.1 Uncharacterised protein [Serratia ficaria]CAI0847228.1 Uncharacterised protein [Serratia ficaria]CAI0858960.1 Uncharacterised protein [Serratia ficaria]CAI0890148.1 Uncharacterised protein [Serratia ficaria]